jgi:hypothetical protein
MSNDEGNDQSRMPNKVRRFLGHLSIRASFVIRASSFKPFVSIRVIHGQMISGFRAV